MLNLLCRQGLYILALVLQRPDQLNIRVTNDSDVASLNDLPRVTGILLKIKVVHRWQRDYTFTGILDDDSSCQHGAVHVN
jgi:hypothetical protein